MTTFAHIYYLEDDAVLRENYTELLEDAGFRVTGFNSVTEFLEGCDASMPDIYLLDITIGSDSDAGFDVCRELRNKTSATPIMILTSHDSTVDEMVGFETRCR